MAPGVGLAGLLVAGRGDFFFFSRTGSISQDGFAERDFSGLKKFAAGGIFCSGAAALLVAMGPVRNAVKQKAPGLVSWL